MRLHGVMNFDEDEPEFLDYGFASNLFGNGVNEADFVFWSQKFLNKQWFMICFFMCFLDWSSLEYWP
jgi:hypothetical protein